MLSIVHIVTKDSLKRKKSIGGDFWWVTVIGSISFHIDIIDNMDGTYVGQFEVMEYGNYTMHVVLEYSLCDGIRDPPTWWFKKGLSIHY